MKSNLILILSLLLIIANSKVLKQEQHDGQVQIFMEMEKDEEVIDFQQDFQSDQITCRLSDCSCYFTKENEDQINNIECEGHFMSFFRTNSSRRITAETYTDSDMPNSLTVSSSLTLKWKFNIDGTIEFATIWKKLSWLGIGFGSNMKNVDMIAINVSGQTVSLIDLYSTSDNTPSTDSSQDLTLISYTVGTSSVSTRFSRKLSTGDTKDKALIDYILNILYSGQYIFMVLCILKCIINGKTFKYRWFLIHTIQQFNCNQFNIQFYININRLRFK